MSASIKFGTGPLGTVKRFWVNNRVYKKQLYCRGVAFIDTGKKVVKEVHGLLPELSSGSVKNERSRSTCLIIRDRNEWHIIFQQQDGGPDGTQSSKVQTVHSHGTSMAIFFNFVFT